MWTILVLAEDEASSWCQRSGLTKSPVSQSKSLQFTLTLSWYLTAVAGCKSWPAFDKLLTSLLRTPIKGSHSVFHMLSLFLRGDFLIRGFFPTTPLRTQSPRRDIVAGKYCRSTWVRAPGICMGWNGFVLLNPRSKGDLVGGGILNGLFRMVLFPKWWEPSFNLNRHQRQKSNVLCVVSLMTLASKLCARSWGDTDVPETCCQVQNWTNRSTPKG